MSHSADSKAFTMEDMSAVMNLLMKQVEEKDTQLKSAWKAREAVEKVYQEEHAELEDLKKHYTDMVKQVMEVSNMEAKRQKEFLKMKAESEAELEAAVTGAGLRKALADIEDYKGVIGALNKENKELIKANEALSKQYDDALLVHAREEDQHRDINRRLQKENAELLKAKNALSKQYDDVLYSYTREDVNQLLNCHGRRPMTQSEWEDFEAEFGYKDGGDGATDSIAEAVWDLYQEMEEEKDEDEKEAHACLKPACPNKTLLNWCDECIKDPRRSQHASFPFKAVDGPTGPSGPTGTDIPEGLKGHIHRWGVINGKEKDSPNGPKGP